VHLALERTLTVNKQQQPKPTRHFAENRFFRRHVAFLQARAAELFQGTEEN
jgi:hypothetical protein